MDNMDDGTTNVAMTVAERSKLSGLDTGDKLTVTAVEKADIATISDKVDQEGAQDSVGLILTDTNTVDLSYDDDTPEITADVKYQNSTTTSLTEDVNGLQVNVTENTSTQKIDVSKAGILSGNRKEINFIEGNNVTLTLTDDAVDDRVNIEIASTAVAGSIAVQKDDVNVVDSTTELNFEGSLEVIADGANKATVRISGATAIETVANVEALTGNDLSYIYVKETSTLYEYDSTSGDTRDGLFILNTGDVGDTRWVAVAGQYVAQDINIKQSVYIQDNTITLANIDTPTDINADGAGIIVKGDTDKSITWNNTTGDWDISEGVNLLSGESYKINNNEKLTETDLNIQNINLDLTNLTAPSEGVLNWNAEDGTAQLGLSGGNVSLQLGQETVLRCQASEDILNGQVVYISGASGSKPIVSLGDNTSLTSSVIIGMATENITSGNQGYVTLLGLVRDVDTSSFSVGDLLWLTTNGNITNIRPEAPSFDVAIGVAIRINATEGVIAVRPEIIPRLQGLSDVYLPSINDGQTIQWNGTTNRFEVKNDSNILKEPTGFFEPENVTVSYDSTTRTITLGGTVQAYYRGALNETIVSGYTSTPHPDIVNRGYFLVYDGSTINWKDLSVDTIDFSDLLIAYVNYGDTNKWAIRECHGLMQWQSHKSDHYNIGTYRLSGGTVANYTLNSTVTSDRQPSVSATLIYDEDLPTINPALSAGGVYTQYYLSATDTPNFNTTATNIVPLSGNQPYWNQNNSGTYQQTLLQNNEYMAVWLVAVPTTTDAESQSYRYIWQQGQFASANLEDIESRSPQQVDRGQLENLTPESVYIGKIIIRYQGGNWQLISVENLTGNRLSQATSPAGLYLSTITTTTDFAGLGTTNSPLDLSGTFTPSSDSTTAYQWFKDDGATQVMNLDTLNEFVNLKGSHLSGTGLNSGYLTFGAYRDSIGNWESLETSNSGVIGTNGDLAFYGDTGVSVGTFTPTERVRIKGDTGNVGFGKNIVNYRIDSIGDINTDTDYRINGVSINTAGTLTNISYLNQANAFTETQSLYGDSTYWEVKDSTNTSTRGRFGTTSDVVHFELFNGSSQKTVDISSEGLSYFTGGNVGFGRNTADYPVDAFGDINVTGTYRIAGVDIFENLFDISVNSLDDIDDGTTYGKLELTAISSLTSGANTSLHFHSSDRDRANHTGTQTANTISDFDTEVSNNSDVVDSFKKSTDTMDNILDGTTYVKTENNYDDVSKAKVDSMEIVQTDTINIETKTVVSYDASLNKGAIVQYCINSDSSARTGQLFISTIPSTEPSIAEFSNGDIGDTSSISFDVALVGDTASVLCTSTSPNWTIKYKVTIL